MTGMIAQTPVQTSLAASLGVPGDAAEPDYRLLFEAASTPCLVLAADLTVMAVNQAYLSMISAGRDDVVGRPITDIPAAALSQWDTLADDLVRSLNRVLLSGRPDTLAVGHAITVSDPVVDSDGKVGQIIVRLEEVTDDEPDRHDQPAGQTYPEPRRPDDMARNAEGRPGPQAALRAAAELLTANGAVGHPTLAALRRRVGAMARMADNLLDAAEVLTGGLTLNCEPLDLRSVVTAAVERIQPEFASTGRTLALSSPSVPVRVDGDRVRLTQLLDNLLGNALASTSPGGRVTVDLRRRADTAVVTVTDDGVGFDPADTDRLFEVFADTGDLGLGLPISRGIAELHHGSLQADSDGPDTGARFTVRVPLRTGSIGISTIPAPGRHHLS